jgi:hypothetical protein
MAHNEQTPKLSNGAVWPLRYVADPKVAAINPRYSAETGKAYPFVPMENVREQCEGLLGFGSRVLDGGGHTFFKNGDIETDTLWPRPILSRQPFALVSAFRSRLFGRSHLGTKRPTPLTVQAPFHSFSTH